jgi:hypothetical protein
VRCHCRFRLQLLSLLVCPLDVRLEEGIVLWAQRFAEKAAGYARGQAATAVAQRAAAAEAAPQWALPAEALPLATSRGIGAGTRGGSGGGGMLWARYVYFQASFALSRLPDEYTSRCDEHAAHVHCNEYVAGARASDANSFDTHSNVLSALRALLRHACHCVICGRMLVCASIMALPCRHPPHAPISLTPWILS